MKLELRKNFRLWLLVFALLLNCTGRVYSCQWSVSGCASRHRSCQYAWECCPDLDCRPYVDPVDKFQFPDILVCQ
ncbi:hypothetical protein BOX15_Mlig024450g3 [Macrostomum lignano]|uniref:Uncharacterized protein n=1 Tax=Macrostomum lignano TaxID=282301 RepID=A0A267DYE2_9PLAT|nr:hypothetical protein BOX15_Mlig024450g3 [Macrostomum lignano]